MTRQDVHEIVQWLYINDGRFPDKLVWREELVKMLLQTANQLPPMFSTKYNDSIPFTPGKITNVYEDEHMPHLQKKPPVDTL